MKINCVLGCFLLLLTLNLDATAQLVAGSPEDRLYTQIEQTTDADQKIQLCLQFERQFPESPVLVDIYTMLMDLHNQRNESDEGVEYGEKAIALDGNNFSALMSVARTLAVTRDDIPKAIEYAERAVSVIEGMKADPEAPYPAEYLTAIESDARNILSYAQTVR